MAKKRTNKKSSQPAMPEPIPPPTENVDLVDDLFAQLESTEPTDEKELASVLNSMDQNVVSNKGKTADSRKRFEARQLRKAARRADELANSANDPDADARLELEARREEQIIQSVCDELGLTMHEINPDGHCLFSAVADQLQLLNVLPPAVANYATTRIAASQYMYTHPDDFLPFLPSESGEDGTGARDAGLMTPAEFERYCANVRDTGIWGGEPEILALSRVYNVPIHVIQSEEPRTIVHNPNGVQTSSLAGPAVCISYHRRMYGLGEHYNSLRPSTISSLTLSGAF